MDLSAKVKNRYSEVKVVDMKISVIIAVYKDIKALSLIIEALKQQTYKNFEVVIAEDNESKEIKEFISSIHGMKVEHTFQEDVGIRKTKSLNNGILKSEGEYLIFLDGDCVPYSTFVEAHKKLAENGYVVSGRRCNLGPKYSKALRENSLSSIKLEKTFLLQFPFIFKDAIEKHAEAGFYFPPDGFVYKKILKKRASSTSLLGCNYSCFRKDLVAINGYDEGFGETAVGSDTDLEWRFKARGLKMKSAKNVANVFHLYHRRTFRKQIETDNALNLMQENKAKNQFVCKNGLDKH